MTIKEDPEKKTDYIDGKKNFEKIIRTELIFAPFLIILPLFVGCWFIFDWYIRDFVLNNLDLTAELLLGIMIIFGNIIFDIPFLKSLRVFSQKK